MSATTKYPRAVALEVARELCKLLEPACERLIVAGSLRRKKPEVGDVEILYVPKLETVREDFFEANDVPATQAVLAKAIQDGVLEARTNALGFMMWGAKNKLARHMPSGIPVDLFTATEANWWNYLVCRTGPAENNTRIAMAAQDKGWKWNPYGPGFTDAEGALVSVTAERDVFDLVGLPYREPWER